jgi:DnaJ domain/PASTA domain
VCAGHQGGVSTWYEVLGVPQNASNHEIRQAFHSKLRRLKREDLTSAPAEVRDAATKAIEVLNQAWTVLGDRASRVTYDHQLSRTQSATEGLRSPGTELGAADDSPMSGMWIPGAANVVMAGLGAVSEWLTPHEKLSRRVQVPDLVDMKSSDAWMAVSEADLHMNLVQLTENPAPVDGTVVGQDPAAGSWIARHGTVTVQVRHPNR